MSDFGNYGGGSMEAKKQQVMDQVRGELALANAQELVNKINEKCFARCVLKPGGKLDNSEQTCVANCMDRYMEAWNIVSRTYIGRVQREAQNMGGGGGL
ncbi:Mitochondrial import inner membrane translocase subunit Tim13 [Dissophora globulifera]|uniref:Mitochondrial import inner membrane translocase subunit n=1 Tax=Dissophora globulifera TaxID=979702 RepID=A0A9P6RI69_9FUNG|nr:Mitochondrial import inner membrane translocase subunit Tim13 [Dissophora globulifera]